MCGLRRDFEIRQNLIFKGNTAQFPPCGLSTAPAAAALRIMRYCPNSSLLPPNLKGGHHAYCPVYRSGIYRDPAFEKSDGDLRTARAGAAADALRSDLAARCAPARQNCCTASSPPCRIPPPCRTTIWRLSPTHQLHAQALEEIRGLADALFIEKPIVSAEQTDVDLATLLPAGRKPMWLHPCAGAAPCWR